MVIFIINNYNFKEKLSVTNSLKDSSNIKFKSSSSNLSTISKIDYLVKSLKLNLSGSVNIWTKIKIIPKIYKLSDFNLVLNPEDTSKLSYGEYWYDVQLTTEDNKVYTVIGPARFVLREEVTF